MNDNGEKRVNGDSQAQEREEMMETATLKGVLVKELNVFSLKGKQRLCCCHCYYKCYMCFQ